VQLHLGAVYTSTPSHLPELSFSIFQGAETTKWLHSVIALFPGPV